MGKCRNTNSFSGKNKYWSDEKDDDDGANNKAGCHSNGSEQAASLLAAPCDSLLVYRPPGIPGHVPVSPWSRVHLPVEDFGPNLTHGFLSPAVTPQTSIGSSIFIGLTNVSNRHAVRRDSPQNIGNKESVTSPITQETRFRWRWAL